MGWLNLEDEFGMCCCFLSEKGRGRGMEKGGDILEPETTN